MDKYKEIEEKEIMTTLDRNLIELQKTIIFYGEQILEEIKKLKIDSTSDKDVKDSSICDPITTHLKKVIAAQKILKN